MKNEKQTGKHSQIYTVPSQRRVLFFSHFKLLVLTEKNVLRLMAHKQSAASFPDNRGFCFQSNQENAEMTVQT